MRRLLTSLSALSIILCSLTPRQTKAAQSTKDSSAEGIYRVSYTVLELEKGKVTNSRSYVLMAREGRQNSSGFRAGNRIPIFTQMGNGKGETSGQVQYENVGINIDCRVVDGPNGPTLWTRFESSSVAPGSSLVGGNPVLRSIDFNDDAAVKLGEQTLVGKLDDVATDHTYEIEATVTKVR